MQDARGGKRRFNSLKNRRNLDIQVAKLAGMPEAVIERAKTVLEKLEREGRVLQKLLNEHPTTDATPQLVLFEDA